MSTDFILDFETLGVSDDAVLLSVGVFACPDIHEYDKHSFSEFMKTGLHYKINRAEQIQNKRRIEQSTLNWWKDQGDEAKIILTNDNLVNIKDVYLDICKYFFDNGFSKKESKIWSRGLIDQRWWASFCNTVSQHTNTECIDFFPFYIWRDTRTALELLTGNVNGNISFENNKEIIKHNALCDCIMDYIRISEAIING